MESVMERFEEWAHLRHHDQSQTPAPGPVTLASAPPEEKTMSLSADLHAVASRLEALGETAVDDLEAVAANPETAKAFTALRDLTGLNIAPGIINVVASGLSALVTEVKGAGTATTGQADGQAAQASFTPAGPQVAGQA